ncbi:hypothetical protein GGR56DRAFT_682681 [Xylariaceae sp. FL0804]|nr:hypothetical protein GGR56DRAFT_682681 [Xylariaceae sp. FL0804]
MPYFRGIEISIATNHETRQLPEYPHPDGSSVRLVRPGAALHDLRDGRALGPGTPALSQTHETDPTRQKKLNPRVSVYVPSLPGEQFWLRYAVNQSPPPSRCIFFKMAINGRHIVSWGIDTTSRPSGSVTRALYEPCDKKRDRPDFGHTGPTGIETRYFHFMLGLDKKSVAEDGGLIMVQVFRCRGRRRITPQLDSYRHQDRYGITYPSGGLVDNPEDATYFDYHLVDAKEAPYATFCFHYRSMKHLEQLNLVPQRDFRPLYQGSTADMETPLICSSDTMVPGPSGSSAGQFAFGVESLDSKVFDDSADNADLVRAEDTPSVANPGQYTLRSPPALSLPPLGPISTAEQPLPLKIEITREILQRPLPELPKSHSRPSSASSLRSSCPSLTPSLKQYVESEDFELEDIRLSTAKPLLIPSESMQALELAEAGLGDGEAGSLSDYTASPSSTEASQSPELPSPGGYLPTTGSVLERHLKQFDSPIAQSSPRRGRSRNSAFASDSFLAETQNIARHSAIHLTEAQWLRSTPSPLRRRSAGLERIWSPRPEKRSPVCEPVIGGAAADSRAGSVASYEEASRNISHTNDIPVGNWI